VTVMDNETIDMLRSSLRHVLTEGEPGGLSQRLAELGWDEVVADDGPTALRLLFEQKGETLSASDALGPAMAAVLADRLGEQWVAGLAVALSDLGTSVDTDGARFKVTTHASSHRPSGDLVVPVRDGGLRLAVVPGSALTSEPLDSLDPFSGIERISADVGAGDVQWLAGDVSTAWEAAVARGRWLVAAELVAIGHHVLSEVVEYTKARIQYGKPIGSFQALQHRVGGAHALVVGAGWVVDEASRTDDPWTSMVAKSLAGNATEHACRQAQQCYGAIGFTWEHEFHRSLRRAWVLDQILGDWRSLDVEIGNRLQETGHAPRIGSLG
jgi:hypothetical protein